MSQQFTDTEIRMMLALLQAPGLHDSGLARVLQTERRGEITNISNRTVQTHINNILAKTPYSSRAELLRAVTNGEINLNDYLDFGVK